MRDPARGSAGWAILRGAADWTLARRSVAASAAASLLLGLPAVAAAQDLEDNARLAGVEAVGARAEVAWDEAITIEAGGATRDQFLMALEQTFRETISNAARGPDVTGDEDRASDGRATVACHVDTYYETGLIVYALRTQLELTGEDGRPIIVWIRSWVGSFPAQQLHLMFTLGEQCAQAFLEDWAAAN